eukprot:GEMP01051499.1.p1 GENE.GEMP01051499.1~~GEMP01051499.1.p1  ORF type:complete len:384 (+),score=60.52 GEMP01051499.1:380-1531(+)
MDPFLGFCRGAVNYAPAVPQPTGGNITAAAQAKTMQSRALTTFAYHLSGMGLEYWDVREPAKAGPCIQAVWRLACYTYFPQSPSGCNKNSPTKYLRPCQSSCNNYVKDCGIECCDESVECVFTHTKKVNKTGAITTSGYSSAIGPSSLCTGSASSVMTWIPLALSILWSGNRVMMLAMATLIIQGWDVKIPMHRVGNWRGQKDYLMSYQFVPPGVNAEKSSLNSCSLVHLAPALQCSGRGSCKTWNPNEVSSTITFCQCDRAWADPECRTKRKSQVTAYLLSVFIGFLGADQFYLGFPIFGAMKLCTLGGFGLWWLYDIVRIGSAPVYSSDFRVASDLPHWAFVISSVTFAFVLGFALVLRSTMRHVRNRRKEQLLKRDDGIL